jgi:hypothetical protein
MDRLEDKEPAALYRGRRSLQGWVLDAIGSSNSVAKDVRKALRLFTKPTKLAMKSRHRSLDQVPLKLAELSNASDTFQLCANIRREMLIIPKTFPHTEI